METIHTLHRAEYGCTPTLVSRVPGVTMLFGGFGYLHSGWAITGTSDAYLELAVSPRDDNMVKLYNGSLNDRKKFNLSGIKYRREDRWGNFIKGVIAQLVSEEYEIPGMDITVCGSLLLADNIHVSTGLAIATMVAVNRYCSLDVEPNSMVRIAYQANTSFSGEECYLPSVITSLEAEPGKVLFFDLSSMQYRKLEFPFANEKNLSFICIDGKVPVKELREQLEMTREETREAIKLLRSFKPKGLLRDFPLSELSDHEEEITQQQKDMLSFLIEECNATKEAAEAIEEKDIDRIASLMRNVEKKMQYSMEVSCPEVDWLIKRASETPGCEAAIQVYSGFSSTIMMLLTEKGKALFRDRVDEYEHIFGFATTSYQYATQRGAEVLKTE